jgi:hypothetical protein
MSKPRFNQVTYAILGNLDRRMLGGVFIGVAIMASTMATAGGSSQWFSNLFSTSSGSASTSLISTQSSVIDTAIQADVANCDQPGGISFAIKTAMQVHSEIASATPNVESLFDVNSNCFSGIGQIFDLSFAIPSLASILSAAQNALLAYAQKKVCTAVNQVTGMVTTPINGAIAKVNTITGFVDINGNANTAVGGAMATIDPQLGAQYHPTVPSGTYTVGTSFGTSQTTFPQHWHRQHWYRQHWYRQHWHQLAKQSGPNQFLDATDSKPTNCGQSGYVESTECAVHLSELHGLEYWHFQYGVLCGGRSHAAGSGATVD